VSKQPHKLHHEAHEDHEVLYFRKSESEIFVAFLRFVVSVGVSSVTQPVNLAHDENVGESFNSLPADCR
jgi:hypothetical protein